MIFRICSDIHLEFRPDGYFLPGLESDSESTLLLAGDIGSGKRLTSLIHFLTSMSTQFKHVLYVLGNHEHYSWDIEKTYEAIQYGISFAGLKNVHLLENEFFDIPNEQIRIFGATLWTDCNRNNPVTKTIIRQYLADFNCAILRDGKKFTPDDAYELFRGTLAWMNEAVQNTPEDYKRILLVHHGVTMKSVHPKYGEGDANFGFVSEIGNELINWGIDLAIHGHTHMPVDYMVGDRCRVIAEPVGYPRENDFPYVDKIIEVTNE